MQYFVDNGICHFLNCICTLWWNVIGLQRFFEFSICNRFQFISQRNDGWDNIQAFIDEMVSDHAYDRESLENILKEAKFQERIIEQISKPAERTLTWAEYRPIFMTKERVNAGAEFWREHRDALQQVSDDTGVPIEIMVGIIGVETYYGRITGGFKVLDALATLAFDFPSEHPRAAERQAFFRNELAEFLKLCRENGLDPSDVRGSYAGALGWPQFMPGSWRQHAVDFDGDGRIDLISSPVDAIGSVAHYLAEYGWQHGEATHYSVKLPADLRARARLLAPDIKPSFTAAELLAAGAQPSEAARDHAGPMAVIQLQNGPHKPPTVLLGTQNFWVVTRYNWSAYYALAVIELGRAVKAKRPPATTPPAGPAPSAPG